jgi:hypothetical protein
MYQNFIIPYLYEAQHVLGDTLLIIRSLKLHWQPLVFHTWEVVGRVVGGCQAQREKARVCVGGGPSIFNPSVTSGTCVSHLQRVFSSTLG